MLYKEYTGPGIIKNATPNTIAIIAVMINKTLSFIKPSILFLNILHKLVYAVKDKSKSILNEVIASA